ncbi:Na-translocating system protein MpsC family protein [Caldinitratiruptor microaerophilus]|uniref:Na+-translocating membrane potential-generating system MpsC domain-containing protein n=1 Tax=Caldinitratiruptor microaerophilus TaxID=671077 RepID=A0AA35CIL5_9FIRM|nr:Na-translocating system protein MpsC family protein [Caldinitratiruptor microaerophilus]BDG59023.1 hypothetical protein caldi_01130 [Caldinitratiruptor microaerophilus]
MRLGDLKQEVMRINNRVNQEVFGTGLVWQRVEVVGPRVLVILAENRRLKALSTLNGAEELTARLTDIALLRQYKERLRRQLEEGLGVSVRAVLKDYDGEAQLAGTVVFLDTSLTVE